MAARDLGPARKLAALVSDPVHVKVAVRVSGRVIKFVVPDLDQVQWGRVSPEALVSGRAAKNSFRCTMRIWMVNWMRANAPQFVRMLKMADCSLDLSPRDGVGSDLLRNKVLLVCLRPAKDRKNKSNPESHSKRPRSTCGRSSFRPNTPWCKEERLLFIGS